MDCIKIKLHEEVQADFRNANKEKNFMTGNAKL